ncbi:MAG: methyltransferase domain-containing protein [Anaerolineales bacterium]|nr:methyltransferase domain-containing protein [Anaerolineales bacterium]
MLPAQHLLELQADWLAPARSRALRQAEIGRRRRVLDLGCGFGAVTEELQRRCGGIAVALDRDPAAVRAAAGERLLGLAQSLPLATRSIDLLFAQFSFLWMPMAAVAEAARVLSTDGVIVALEPDYDGLIEWPADAVTRELWLAALKRAGAEPLIGRQLPGRFAACGLRVEVELLNTLAPPVAERLDFLRELPLTDAERARLTDAAAATVAHLPVFIVTARW